MKYRNIHTGEVYKLFSDTVVTINNTTKKRTTEKNALFLSFVSGNTEKSKEPFRVNEDWNKFNTFKKI